MFKVFYPDESTLHSHYPRFELILFSRMVVQKRLLVRPDIYWQNVDMTASCHRFIQQVELCHCPCIARVN